MGLKILTIVSALLVSQAALAATSEGFGSTKPANLQLHEQTEVPDAILKAGSYSIRIADHLADRVIVDIHSSTGVDEKFLGVPSRDLQKSSTGPVYEKGQHSKAALRGFTFPGNNAIEFVYPKDAAVALAKANGKATLAVDPSSEGMQPDSGLSAADMKIVTLWLLKPTHVGPGSTGPGIEAARYASSAGGRSEHAENRPPVLARLPKTASDLPLIALTGAGALVMAMFFSFRRLRAGAL